MEKFILYLGLNDKDTKTQKISTWDAGKIIENMITKKFDGGTVSPATGIYKHDNGDIVTENTIRIELLFAPREEVIQFCNELKVMFNQESIALQSYKINSELV